ncbi:MAG: hypothetical protein RBU21_25090 [FCB group bacterium]|jgi:hypothetical protein|nr:hypothetical protein [FCB group bacterium]
MDPNIQKLTLTACDGLIRDQLLIPVAQACTGIHASTIESMGYPTLKYEAWKAAKDQNPGIKSAVDQVDSMMQQTSLSLSGIRLLSKDSELKRTQFAAELQLSDSGTNPRSPEKINIAGSAQLTEDGQVYVQVTLVE